MSDSTSRRTFLARSLAAATATGVAGGTNLASAQAADGRAAAPVEPADRENGQYGAFSRWRPGRGNPVDSDYYLGKLVPGFRPASAGPAPFVAPDLDKLPYKLRGGAKEFHLVAQPITREILPGYEMNFYGYNGSMPGPTIEVTQGDRVRIVVTNELTEDTQAHWHGFELPVQYDGASTLTQAPIKPGQSYVYEFDVHEAGTFFYHPHVAMQEAFGMVGWFIVHPREVWSPPVDRDFGLLFQNFFIDSTQTIPNSWEMDWNWQTINGRSGPFTTPLVVKHGERVRIRILDFSPMQHHPIHMHGHTFWITGHEGARIPTSAWIPRNTALIGVAQATDYEFIANNPGDWMLHCHMVHHMMNHMVRQVGPRIRRGSSVEQYLANLDAVPPPVASATALGREPPGYPQQMLGMSMSKSFMERIWNRREVQGMRADWLMAVKGLMTVLRVLPADLYHEVMETDRQIPKGYVFDEIVKRFGDWQAYQHQGRQAG